MRDVIKYINENYGKRKELEAARAAAVERRKAESREPSGTDESVQQDGTPPASSGGSADAIRGGRTAENVSDTRELIDPRTMSDDERQRRGEMLRTATAIEVSPNQIVSTKDKSARKVAEEWWDNNVGEAQWYDTEAGEVEINRNSIESSLAHRYGQMKLDAITSLVDGFGNAVYLGTMPDGTRQDGVLNHYFAYPINYNGRRCYVFCRALHDNNTKRLYVHEVFVEENIKRGNTLQTAASQPHGGIALYRDVLANVLDVKNKEVAVSKDGGAQTEQSPVTVPVATSRTEPGVSKGKGTTNSPIPNELGEKIAEAEAEVNTNPTEKQKEAGNYKKGHVQIGTFNVTIEQPKGSVRSGVDANGKAEYVTDKMIAEMNDKAKRGMPQTPEAKRTEAERLAKKLNTPINIIDDASTIEHDNPTIQARRRKSKGWYDTATGNVNIVLSNNRNVEDVAATVLHETVGHKGLRELIGEDNYNDFLREVYEHCKVDVRRRIAKLAEKHNWDFEKATDEYLSGLAEKDFEDFDREERSVWQWLKEKVLKAIDKFLKSLKLPKWVKLGDNELRYMLWRSKERMERGREDYVDRARDMVKREELGLTDAARYNMGDAPETFKARQKRAVENKGTVMPGLNKAEVKVVDVPKHTYKGNIAETTRQAIDAAKAKYAPDGKPKTLHYDNFGASFDYAISGNAVEESLNPKQQAKSVNKGVHLAMVEHLDEIIGQSIEVEEHPDYMKNERDEREQA